jgi:hypothetical protein
MNSWERLVDEHPHIRFRITKIMPSKRVSALSHTFTTREHFIPPSEGVSWAHFDLDIVIDIVRKIRVNPGTPMQYSRRDQAALIHLFSYVDDFKACVPNHATMANGTQRNDENAIGKTLTQTVCRHHLLPFRIFSKRCFECGEQSIPGFWIRAGRRPTAEVTCDNCVEHPNNAARMKYTREKLAAESSNPEIVAVQNTFTSTVPAIDLDGFTCEESDQEGFTVLESDHEPAAQNSAAQDTAAQDTATAQNIAAQNSAAQNTATAQNTAAQNTATAQNIAAVQTSIIVPVLAQRDTALYSTLFVNGYTLEETIGAIERAKVARAM